MDNWTLLFDLESTMSDQMPWRGEGASAPGAGQGKHESCATSRDIKKVSESCLHPAHCTWTGLMLYT